MNSKLSINGRTVYYSEFSDEAAAMRYARNGVKLAVVLGDAESGMPAMVMVLADAQRCERAGFTVRY